MIFQKQSVNLDNKSKKFFIYVISIILLFYGISIGINLTSFSLFLYQMNIPKSEISNILSLELIGTLVAAPFFTKLCEKFSIFLILSSSLILKILSIIVFPIAEDIKLNMICLFFAGAGNFGAICSIWFWVSSILPLNKKATIIALMQVAFSIGVAIGIGTLLFKASKMPIDLFKTSALFSSIILIPIFLYKNAIPNFIRLRDYPAPSKIIGYVMIPLIIIVISNYLAFSLNSYGIVYAIKSNIAYRNAALINIYMLLGNIIFTVPAAFLIDKTKSTSLAISIILASICLISIATPFTISMAYAPMIIFGMISPLVTLLFVIGMSTIYTKFSSNNLLSAITIAFLLLNFEIGRAHV